MPATTPGPQPQPQMMQPQTQQISLACAGHTRPVVQLSFSRPTASNRYFLISACKDGKPILRDGPTGDWLGTFLGHKGAVWSAMLNASTTRAVTASADYTAKVWDAIAGHEIVTLAHGNIVKGADFCGDDETVVTGGQDMAVRLFDLRRPDAPTTLAAHAAPVRCVKWSAHRALVVSADSGRVVTITDPRAAGAAAPVKTLEMADDIASVSLTSDGRLLSCAAGRRVCIWDLDAFRPVADFAVDYDVSVAAVDPKRTRIVTGGRSDLLVRSAAFDDPAARPDIHKGHHGPVHDVCFSPDGRIYATGSEDGTVRLWQTVPGTEYGLWQYRRIHS
ncbi:hypothetical protein H4R18_000611 [Coemansia javaensis]|uniref:Serine-threonine kinase receptor-associated protein n=1 Tax=Coemansia javaensis TaxID=2761396 RepID=A0A9W8HG89_9FUNG|nr:hypothetical protein H4R18_000611 [Coemansia javaensis]